MHKKIFPIAIIVALLVFIILAVNVIRYSPFIFQFLFNQGLTIKNENGGLNLLLLGIGGGAHEGPNLTDTIIYVNIDSKNSKVTLVSIPRDLWIPDLKAKINTAYHLGETKKKGGGLVLIKAVVEKVLNKPIDYVVRVDFEGFTKAVDLIGGIDVDVERTLDDYEYPIAGKEEDLCGHKTEEIEALSTSSSQLDAFPCRYQHIHFDKGIQHMDGKMALMFVRSRHAKGEEGTDFARSKRQEKILKAFKDKIFSIQTLFNPVKVISLYATLNQNIDTNIKESEVDDFIRLSQKLKNTKIKSVVLDYGDENRTGLLTNPFPSSEYKNQWVLIPRTGNGDFSEIHEYIECETKSDNCIISSQKD